jgi:tetratricopeptide (TPR) repeat protein
MRNPDFESNQTLLTKDIKASSESAKMQYAYGTLIAQQAQAEPLQARRDSLSQAALPHLDKAVEIYPSFLEAYYMRGNVNFMLGRFDRAIENYHTSLQLNPNYSSVYGNYALALREHARRLIETKGDTALAIQLLEESKRLFPNEPETDRLLGLARQK